MATLEAPSLAGSRDRAQELLAELPSDLSNSEVILDCHGLLAATVSFADELVQEVLVRRKAQALHAVRVTDQEFADYLVRRADVHGVSDRLTVSS
ncbi:hypothetical protein GOARA_048_01330 [Gordonia araii NBRC 100433]|uniref:STAS domain-containing protein n=1 Tax=Gordonia araii NBRC 100433 TaxID=1073574 RepID=G7H256_9ACTN|nr:hypothetical protein [Gordonia araii]NNG97264.1 hypothetical protein [Gordonia araii NBRC 100433]GAB09931.1 hypothetical protein GOARA_048_01330 [Gordonia araii NBRC 100433]